VRIRDFFLKTKNLFSIYDIYTLKHKVCVCIYTFFFFIQHSDYIRFILADFWASLYSSLLFGLLWQSDREKSEGLPVAPFMDREKVTKPTAQIGFIKFVLIPMFETVMKVCIPTDIWPGTLNWNDITWRLCLCSALSTDWGDHGSTFERLPWSLWRAQADRWRHVGGNKNT